MEIDSKLISKLKKIKLVALDIDGTLTDGSIYISGSRDEFKRFDVKDGAGIVMAIKAGIRFAIISGRYSKSTFHRADELGIEVVKIATVDKGETLKEIMDENQLTPDQVVFIGDDILDISAMKVAGIGVAVADSTEDTLAAADYITLKKGGQGAVREFIDLILDHI
ncbi:MAG: KdsC family phosphatase [Nitrospinota bacterium]